MEILISLPQMVLYAVGGEHSAVVAPLVFEENATLSSRVVTSFYILASNVRVTGVSPSSSAFDAVPVSYLSHLVSQIIVSYYGFILNIFIISFRILHIMYLIIFTSLNSSQIYLTSKLL